MKGPALPVFRRVQTKQVQSGRVAPHDTATHVNHDNAFGHCVEEGFELFLLILELVELVALGIEEPIEPVLDIAQLVVFEDRQSGQRSAVRSNTQKGAECTQAPPESCPLTERTAQRGKGAHKDGIPGPQRACFRGKEKKEREEQGQQSQTNRKQNGKGNAIFHAKGLLFVRCQDCYASSASGLNLYPTPRTVRMRLGLASSCSMRCRKRRIWTSTVRGSI